jgi:hypothetical protein
VGFLDDLKRQADALKTQSSFDAAAVARNTALVEAACKATLHYFMELAPQLNVLQLKPRIRFSLDSRTPLDNLARGDFMVDSRKQRLRDQDVFDHIVIHGQQKSGQVMTMTKDFPPEIERLESRLRQAGITADVETRRDPDKGRLLHVNFRFTADVILMVKVFPEHDQGRLRFQMVNLDGLETVTAEFPAHAVTTGLLDELARWLTGDMSHGFLKTAEGVKRVEA